VYEGPSTIADIEVAAIDDELLNILFAVIDNVRAFKYMLAREADVSVLVKTTGLVNVPDASPDVIAVRSDSDAGDHDPVTALLYCSKGEL